jgi:hypothetical protein
MALGRNGVKAKLAEFTKDFGDIVVDTLQSQDVAELEAFLSFLVGLEATAHNAEAAVEDRLRKLRIAKKWESPN